MNDHNDLQAERRRHRRAVVRLVMAALPGRDSISGEITPGSPYALMLSAFGNMSPTVVQEIVDSTDYDGKLPKIALKVGGPLSYLMQGIKQVLTDEGEKGFADDIGKSVAALLGNESVLAAATSYAARLLGDGVEPMTALNQTTTAFTSNRRSIKP